MTCFQTCAHSDAPPSHFALSIGVRLPRGVRLQITQKFVGFADKGAAFSYLITPAYTSSHKTINFTDEDMSSKEVENIVFFVDFEEIIRGEQEESFSLVQQSSHHQWSTIPTTQPILPDTPPQSPVLLRRPVWPTRACERINSVKDTLSSLQQDTIPSMNFRITS
ncbi:hypothetical protein QJS10_CPB15g00821 [Acorus calamus]|uniref:Uncharacterized protein n=1 Tax=Acorus calamus TaxID=4465 RepID=A0AAV9D8Z1_ACOCL|nr:hypothetical protein QJS10_CPB15g00821 [Acorus calamus]